MSLYNHDFYLAISGGCPRYICPCLKNCMVVFAFSKINSSKSLECLWISQNGKINSSKSSGMFALSAEIVKHEWFCSDIQTAIVVPELSLEEVRYSQILDRQS